MRITDKLLGELGFQSGIDDDYDDYHYMNDRPGGSEANYWNSFAGISLEAYLCEGQESKLATDDEWWDEEKYDWYVMYEIWEKGDWEDELITDGDRLIEVIKAAKDFRKVILG